MEPGIYFSASNVQPVFIQTVTKHYSPVAGDYVPRWRGAGLAVDNCGGITVGEKL